MKLRFKLFLIVKRLFDFFASFILILFLFLPCLVVALLILMIDHGPIFFVQERVGKNKKVFKLLKFKTMVVGAEKQGLLSNDRDSRITKLGKILRKTSIDELPQLLNIFVGHMSFVGFRPMPTYYPKNISDYSNEESRIFDLRPGVTGWAQVNGRKNLPWDSRFKLNIWYTNNASVLLDIKILFLTLKKVFSNEDNENICDTTLHYSNFYYFPTNFEKYLFPQILFDGLIIRENTFTKKKTNRIAKKIAAVDLIMCSETTQPIPFDRIIQPYQIQGFESCAYGYFTNNTTKPSLKTIFVKTSDVDSFFKCANNLNVQIGVLFDIAYIDDNCLDGLTASLLSKGVTAFVVVDSFRPCGKKSLKNHAAKVKTLINHLKYIDIKFRGGIHES